MGNNRPGKGVTAQTYGTLIHSRSSPQGPPQLFKSIRGSMHPAKIAHPDSRLRHGTAPGRHEVGKRVHRAGCRPCCLATGPGAWRRRKGRCPRLTRRAGTTGREGSTSSSANSKTCDAANEAQQPERHGRGRDEDQGHCCSDQKLDSHEGLPGVFIVRCVVLSRLQDRPTGICQIPAEATGKGQIKQQASHYGCELRLQPQRVADGRGRISVELPGISIAIDLKNPPRC
jgi:hypothetical protein